MILSVVVIAPVNINNESNYNGIEQSISIEKIACNVMVLFEMLVVVEFMNEVKANVSYCHTQQCNNNNHQPNRYVKQETHSS